MPFGFVNPYKPITINTVQPFRVFTSSLAPAAVNNAITPSTQFNSSSMAMDRKTLCLLEWSSSNRLNGISEIVTGFINKLDEKRPVNIFIKNLNLKIKNQSTEKKTIEIEQVISIDVCAPRLLINNTQPLISERQPVINHLIYGYRASVEPSECFEVVFSLPQEERRQPTINKGIFTIVIKIGNVPVVAALIRKGNERSPAQKKMSFDSANPYIKKWIVSPITLNTVQPTRALPFTASPSVVNNAVIPQLNSTCEEELLSDTSEEELIIDTSEEETLDERGFI